MGVIPMGRVRSPALPHSPAGPEVEMALLKAKGLNAELARDVAEAKVAAEKSPAEEIGEQVKSAIAAAGQAGLRAGIPGCRLRGRGAGEALGEGSRERRRAGKFPETGSYCC
jgi:hypothetical protein